MPAPDRPPLSMRDLMAMAEARGEVVSPDGSLLAWLSNASGTHQVWLRDLPDGAPRQATDLPERVGTIAFSPVGRDLIFTMDRGGDERHQLWLIPGADGAPEPLTDDPTTVHLWGCWSPDGTRIAYACNARDPAVMDVRVMTLEPRAAETAMQGTGWCEPLCFTPDGAGLVIRDSTRGPMDQDLWHLDLTSGARRLLLGGPERGAEGAAPTAISAARFAPDGRLMVLCDRAGGFHALFSLDPAGGQVDLVATVPGRDIELFAVPPRQADPGPAALAYASNDAGYSRLHLHARWDGPARAVALPAPGVLGSLRFLPGQTALAMTLETARDPASVWRYDLQADRFTPLASAPRDTVPADALTEPEEVAFTASDGLSLAAFVYRPRRSQGRQPVVFIVHGGPEAQWRPGFRADLHHYLDRGCMVVAPNVRGSTGYGRAFHQADDRDRRTDAVRDLCEMADAVATWPEVDAARIAVTGQSYGGYLAMAALCSRPDLWKTGVSLYGVADFITFMRTTGPWRRALRAAEYGDPATLGDYLAAISPVAQLARMRAPLLLVHATEDPRVTMEQSEQVLAILRGLGRRVEILRIAGEGHGFARRENRLRVFSTIAGFLERTL